MSGVDPLRTPLCRASAAVRAIDTVLLLQTGGVFFASATLGTFPIGEWVQILVRWDSANDRFQFGLLRQGMSPVLTDLAYAESDSDPAAFPNKLIGVRTFPESYTDGSSVADMDASVRSVLVD